MPEQKGKLLTLLKGDGAGPEVFTQIAGMRSNSLSLSRSPTDVGTKDDTDDWMQQALLEDRSMTVSGSGVFKDDAAFSAAHDTFFNGTISNWQVVVPGLGTYEGPFAITSLDVAGERTDVVTFDMELVSTGAVTFVPV